MAEERRRSPRVLADVPARISAGDELIEGRVHDICRDAVLVYAERSWPVGTIVSVETELPRVKGTLRLRGPVVRLADAEGEGPGMAILFDGLDVQARMRIDLFLSEQG